MTVGEMKKMLDGINDEVVIDIGAGHIIADQTGETYDAMWYGIAGLDSTPEQANNYGQVVIIPGTCTMA